MIEVKGLPDYIKSPEVKNILFEHVNKVLRECVVFIGALTGENKVKGFWKKREQKILRERICPEYITTDEERKKVILSLIRKIYKDSIEGLTVEEKFVLSKACAVAIDNEEKVIDILVKEDSLRLEDWMWGRYMIEDTDDRQKVLKHFRKMKVGVEQYPKEILAEKPVNERERILDVIGQTNMLLFEYPTVINLVFDRQEYDLLMGVQMKEEGQDESNTQ